MSHKSKACSVELQVCYHTTCVRVGPRPQDHLNAMERDITTKVLVK